MSASGAPPGIERRRFTTDEYHQLAEVGILGADDRVELLAGEIWEAAAVGSPHAGCVNRLSTWFSARLAGRAIVAVQNPVRLDEHSEPEPDLALLRPRRDFYAGGHPTPADVLLLIEVCDASWSFDRRVKLPLYARAEVPEVWLLHLDERALHIFRRPDGGAFREIRAVGGAERASPEAFPDLVLAASDPFT
jgi:hypothetical protein